jgi:hypothetical protein
MFLPHRSCDRPQRPPHHSLTWDREIAAAFSELPQRTRPTSTLDRGAASPNSPAQPQDPLTPLSTLIPLVGGLLTWVDADDARMVAGWTWSALRRKDGRGWYAVRWETAGGQRRSIYLHRQLLAAPPGSDVVHVNGDGLGNRRTNLRLCTRSQSAASRRTCSPQTGYRGVYRNGRGYQAQITIGGETRSLGQFTTAVAAALEYDGAALEAFGSYARLNFPGVRP